MTAPKIRIRREAAVTGTVGLGVEVKHVWVVRALPRYVGPYRFIAYHPVLAHFPTFEQARRYAAEWVDRQTTTEPPC